MAISAVRRFGIKALYSRAADVITAEVSRDPKRRDELNSADLLVLDEIGCEGTSDLARRAISTLIDRRYGDSLRTIFVSNLPARGAPSIWTHLGTANSERIRERCELIPCPWPSLRRPLPPQQGARK